MPVVTGEAVKSNLRSNDPYPADGRFRWFAPGTFGESFYGFVDLTLDHDYHAVAASTADDSLMIRETGEVLRFQAALSDTAAGRRVLEAFLQGRVGGASVTWRTLASQDSAQLEWRPVSA